MSGPTAKAANEVNAEREIEMNYVRCSASESTLISTTRYFAYVFEMPREPGERLGIGTSPTYDTMRTNSLDTL
jgi:hypothetical protein